MQAKTVMVQGTASSVGKSILVTALCRIFKQQGLKVAPFKAQNMSLNSFVAPDGGEIGRAQAVQAEAAGVEPVVEMNPVLLKPEADNCSQIIIKGKPRTRISAAEFPVLKRDLWAAITESLDTLRAQFDIIVIEGAGSPTEVNLKDRDLVNMRVARYANAPVLLVADIERGGVFASLVGTLELLEPAERDHVKALVINKFRGDLSLLTPGIDWLEQRTRLPIAGIIPYYHDIHIAEEDSMSLERRRMIKLKREYVVDIAVIGLPHIANFDDFDPLQQEQGVRLRYVEANDRLGNPDLIIIPGTKSTIADLAYLQRRGLAQEIKARVVRGTPVIGICGGYQMMGDTLSDPDGVESAEPHAIGLGLLPVTTTFFQTKSTHQVSARVIGGKGLLEGALGSPLKGYEIHMGHTERNGSPAPFLIEERSRTAAHISDGCISDDGLLLGTYLHGLFHNEKLRRLILCNLATRKNVAFHPGADSASQEQEYDRLADWVRSHVDMRLIHRILDLA